MTSFRFPEKVFVFRVRVKVRIRERVRVKVRAMVEVRVRFIGNTFKYVFGQTSIRASVLDPIFKQQVAMNKCFLPNRKKVAQIRAVDFETSVKKRFLK